MEDLAELAGVDDASARRLLNSVAGSSFEAVGITPDSLVRLITGGFTWRGAPAWIEAESQRPFDSARYRVLTPDDCKLIINN